MKVPRKEAAAAVDSKQDMMGLRHEIEALIERARANGYTEVGYFLGVALESLTSAMEEEAISAERDDGEADDDGNADLPDAG